ncbi:MAG: nucleoside-diphosphate kinase [Candidatus Woesearchaeota archaeon]|nr:MAG: nucleoside-diphosphate kinase [Candidatus Woesearchaeota archaeon]
MMEKTLVLIKPDGVQRGLVGDILSRFERVGLKPVAMKMVYPDKEMAGRHYTDDEAWLCSVGEKTLKSYEKKGISLDRTPKEQGMMVRSMLMDFLSMSPVVALALEGHNAVALVRKIVGATAPSDAAPGTIRGDYSFDSYQLADKSERAVMNLIHASDSVENANLELAIWFKDEEIHSWKRILDDLLYMKK